MKKNALCLLSIISFSTFASVDRFDGEYIRKELKGQVREVNYHNDNADDDPNDSDQYDIFMRPYFKDSTSSHHSQIFLNDICPAKIRISSNDGEESGAPEIQIFDGSCSTCLSDEVIYDVNHNERTPFLWRAATLNSIMLGGAKLVSKPDLVSNLFENEEIQTIERVSLSKDKVGNITLKKSRKNYGLINRVFEYLRDEYSASCTYIKQ